MPLACINSNQNNIAITIAIATSNTSIAFETCRGMFLRYGVAVLGHDKWEQILICTPSRLIDLLTHRLVDLLTSKQNLQGQAEPMAE